MFLSYCTNVLRCFRKALHNTGSQIVVCACAESSRVKRMCVAERRQPYSGADWCSGGESDEDDKGFFSKCVNVCIRALCSDPFADQLDSW